MAEAESRGMSREQRLRAEAERAVEESRDRRADAEGGGKEAENLKDRRPKGQQSKGTQRQMGKNG